MRSFAIVLVALVLLTLGSAAADDETDFYAVLQLEQEREDASEKSIKANWRRLSRENHPDIKGEGSREQYKIIQRAYEVLSDRRKRKVYDMKGEEGIKQLEKAGGQQQQQMDPMLKMFFGGGGDNNAAQRGSNVQMVLLCTLEDIYSGATHTVRMNKQRLCKACRGTGAESKSDFQQCSACKGQGSVVQKVQIMPGFFQQMQQQCDRCGGKGKIVKKKCPTCKGKKVSRVEQALQVEIEQGTPENFDLVFDMEADQNPEQIPGDVIFTIQSSPHPRFVRNGHNLELTVKLSLSEALLGFTKTIKHLDGHEVELSEEGITNFGKQRRIADEGLPIHNVPSEKGYLQVTYDVELPLHISAGQRQAIEGLF